MICLLSWQMGANSGAECIDATKRDDVCHWRVKYALDVRHLRWHLRSVTKVVTAFRFEPETIQALNEIAALMSTRAGGVDVKTAEAARVAMRRGIEVLRTELGDDAPSKPQKKKPK
jgi:hypothetical protein